MISDYIFISGTNTDVGKTYFGTKLVEYLKRFGGCLAFKPIETGCKRANKNLVPHDSTEYHKILKDSIDLDEINPYRFLEPVSPYLAIKKAKKKLYLNHYKKKLASISKNNLPIIIEGAGGAFSPFAIDGLNIDFMKIIKSNNILVVKDELGCIGSTLSHYFSFNKYRVKLDCIVLNNTKKNKMDNYNEIKKYVDIPVYLFGNSTVTNLKCFKAIRSNLFAK
tara:strand:+ start:59 stop:724 length:666 start_codon:yes stop_codon:yes gene_type:complete